MRPMQHLSKVISGLGFIFYLTKCTGCSTNNRAFVVNIDSTTKITQSKLVIMNIEEQLNDGTLSIIPFDKTKHWMFFKEGEAHQLSDKELELVDELIKNKIIEYNAAATINFEEKREKFPHLNLILSNYTLQLNDYKRQYLSVKNKEGEVHVFVQCLCKTIGTAWKEDMIHVMDGGKCYFNLEINLNTNTVHTMSVNGEA